MKTTTEEEFEDIVATMLEFMHEEFGDREAKSIHTFGDVGMLTMNKGLVVSLNDGSEFQLTIVKRK